MFKNTCCAIHSMICLGIESTAHTFGVGIMDSNGRVLSNAKELVTTESGGLIPKEVAEHHRQVKDTILANALSEAGVSWAEIDLIAFSQGPGLPPSLRVGRDFARDLAVLHNKPLIGVCHCMAHLTIGDAVCGTTDPVYVYVSGVNTQVIAHAAGRMRVFGETLDVGLGNALDKFGRAAGLGFPAGPKIEQMAKGGKYIELPYSVKGMDVSFAGIVTKVQRLLKEGASIHDLCFSLQETCFAMLTEVTERAVAHTDKKEVLLIGGVAANKRLAEMMTIMCNARGVRFAAVPLALAGDQGAMIAWQGILEYKAGRSDVPEKVDILPYERTDDIDVIWK